MPVRRRLAPLTLLAVAGAAALTGCGGSDSSATDAPEASASSPDAAGVACRYPDSGEPAAAEVSAPPSTSAVSGSVGVTLATSAGDVAMTLDADTAPCTVNSFVSLAKQGYFDGTSCHRLTTSGIFVLQCGDPTGTGAGGPGYSFPDELSGKETYPAGTVAMANAGPDTNGSQFFLVYRNTALPPSYTVFGHLDRAGTKVVAGVAAKGTADGGPDGPPKEPVRIASVTVR